LTIKKIHPCPTFAINSESRSLASLFIWACYPIDNRLGARMFNLVKRTSLPRESVNYCLIVCPWTERWWGWNFSNDFEDIFQQSAFPSFNLFENCNILKPKPGKSYRGGRLSTFDLLVLTSLNQLIFILKTLFSFFT